MLADGDGTMGPHFRGARNEAYLGPVKHARQSDVRALHSARIS